MLVVSSDAEQIIHNKLKTNVIYDNNVGTYLQQKFKYSFLLTPPETENGELNRLLKCSYLFNVLSKNNNNENNNYL